MLGRRGLRALGRSIIRVRCFHGSAVFRSDLSSQRLDVEGYLQQRERGWRSTIEQPSVVARAIEVRLRPPGGNDGGAAVAGRPRIDVIAGATTPFEIAKSISGKLAKTTAVARVDGQLWDVSRPLETDCELELLPLDSPEGRQVFWHSSAHVLGLALEEVFPGAMLDDGPPLADGGFFYDVELPGGQAITTADLALIEAKMKEIVKAKHGFERREVSRECAREMFTGNRYKTAVLDRLPGDESITLYRCGELVDLCLGPHLPHTGLIQAFTLLKLSAVHWGGQLQYPAGHAQTPQLQRVHGIAFPKAKQLKEWTVLQEEAARRDHRRIGTQQKLWFFHPNSPGNAIFLPHGTRIRNRLIDFLKKAYFERGFDEVFFVYFPTQLLRLPPTFPSRLPRWDLSCPAV